MRTIVRLSLEDKQDLTDLPIILFPHTHIATADLKEILASYGNLTICQPWHMDGYLSDGLTGDFPSVKIVRPQENMTPKGNFKALLSEYQAWAMQNIDKDYTAFLKAAKDTALTESTPHEIRQMIRHIKQKITLTPEIHSLRWHIILHLARQFEENTMQAEKKLNELKRGKSPLDEALGGEAPIKGLLQDLPETGGYPFINENHLRQVLEAWLGLFGRYLPDHALLTLDAHVMDMITESYEEDSLSPVVPSTKDPVIVKHLPQITDELVSATDPLLTALSEKTIMLFSKT